jgi:transposase
MTVPRGRHKLERYLAAMPEAAEDTSLSPRTRELIEDMRAEWAALDRRIGAFDSEFAACARADADARRLATIPGIGVLNATALVAAVGTGQTFARGRDLAAWLGLVPRQITTGGKPRLVGITKRGNKYLRTLLIHGARSAMPGLAASATPLGDWLRSLMQRVHKNAAVVALANKLARIVWVVLRKGEEFNAAAVRVAG